MKVVFFDIEAGGLKSPFDQVYCAAFKPYGKKPYLLSRTANTTKDKQLCMDIRDELDKYDIVVTYYGLGFDIPYINGRLLKQGERILPRKLHIDCYRLAKKIFKWTVVSKRLIAICELLGVKGKTRVEPNIWEVMKYGDVIERTKSLRQIGEHCKWDVITLEAAYDKCFKYAINSISLA